MRKSVLVIRDFLVTAAAPRKSFCAEGKHKMDKAAAQVAIVMGSQSDWPTMKAAADALDALGVGYDARIVSAHRTPDRLVDFARGAAAEGFSVIIAGAGGAAHLPGMLASWTTLPVLGVPVESKMLRGVDSLLSIVQMPGGVPVGTMSIGDSGAKNAGLFAVRILATRDAALRTALEAFRDEQAEASLAAELP